MPVHLEFFHPDRIVVGIGRGNVTLEECREFVAGLARAGALHYRKIIDVTSVVPAAVGPVNLIAIEQVLAEHAKERGLVRGPLAIVVERGRSENAVAFKAMAPADRPIEVFYTVREARDWLLRQPVTQPERKAPVAPPVTQ
ncbi:hypothetical protein SAMN02745126_05999 [Enhydrobacter aerosaccus]|uniref:SpoIIAA-like n=1 Tax=Enhydrobacter aerosaccus TaxID=225324 RepID=A0A1T4TC35_9HYPH|nr:hypothetical protein [Enhydrobacter aerosaccus]SKA38054.1 hypothetical protein SAMN02745126_05999 [Enhydrobacter aerosaccus]